MIMATISATKSVNKFFNKFEKSAEYEDILAGTMGLYPHLFDEIKMSKDMVFYEDIITDRANKKHFLNVFAVKKDGRFYDRVCEVYIEIPDDTKGYVEKAKKSILELAAKVDGMGLVK